MGTSVPSGETPVEAERCAPKARGPKGEVFCELCPSRVFNSQKQRPRNGGRAHLECVVALSRPQTVPSSPREAEPPKKKARRCHSDPGKDTPAPAAAVAAATAAPAAAATAATASASTANTLSAPSQHQHSLRARPPPVVRPLGVPVERPKPSWATHGWHLALRARDMSRRTERPPLSVLNAEQWHPLINNHLIFFESDWMPLRGGGQQFDLGGLEKQKVWVPLHLDGRLVDMKQ